MTLKLNRVLQVRAKFNQAKCSGSWVVVRTEKKTPTKTVQSVATARTVIMCIYVAGSGSVDHLFPSGCSVRQFSCWTSIINIINPWFVYKLQLRFLTLKYCVHDFVVMHHMISYRDSGQRADCLAVHIIMAFTDIKLDLAHYNTSVSSSGYRCFVIIINVLATPKPV